MCYMHALSNDILKFKVQSPSGNTKKVRKVTSLI